MLYRIYPFQALLFHYVEACSFGLRGAFCSHRILLTYVLLHIDTNSALLHTSARHGSHFVSNIHTHFNTELTQELWKIQ